MHSQFMKFILLRLHVEFPPFVDVFFRETSGFRHFLYAYSRVVFDLGLQIAWELEVLLGAHLALGT